MKSILMSIRPEWIAKILNGEKTIEVRKKFPKDYVGWVYIYCTKGEEDCFKNKSFKYNSYISREKPTNKKWFENEAHIQMLNGKVVARFWCDKVGIIHDFIEGLEETEPSNRHITISTQDELLSSSCLTEEEIRTYGGEYAIHITKLEIFNKPKDLSEFRKCCDKYFGLFNRCLDCKAYTSDLDLEDYCAKEKLRLTKAPQNMVYVEELL